MTNVKTKFDELVHEFKVLVAHKSDDDLIAYLEAMRNSCVVDDEDDVNREFITRLVFAELEQRHPHRFDVFAERGYDFANVRDIFIKV